MRSSPRRALGVLAGLALAAALVGCPARGSSSRPWPSTSDLHKAASGKTRAQVLSSFGRPTAVASSMPGMWLYEDTFVLVDGKPHVVQLNFDGGGKCTAVQWFPPSDKRPPSGYRAYADGD